MSLCYSGATCTQSPDVSVTSAFCRGTCSSYKYYAFSGNTCNCYNTCTVISDSNGFDLYTSGFVPSMDCPVPTYETCTAGYKCSGTPAFTGAGSLDSAVIQCSSANQDYVYVSRTTGNSFSCWDAASCTSLTADLFAQLAAIQLKYPSTECLVPPTKAPTESPTQSPTGAPTVRPTGAPTGAPTESPTQSPTGAPTVRPTGAPTGAPTESPTMLPTAAPTPFPTSALYDRVATNTYCAGATTVPMAAITPRRWRQLAEAHAAGSDQDLKWPTAQGDDGAEPAHDHTRALAAAAPVEACYAACYAYYSPAPNNAQFFFQLLDINGARECQCCKTCETRVAQPGALLMEACVPPTALRLGPSISRKYIKLNATKPVRATYTLRVKGTTKGLQLKDMGVQLALPAGASASKTSPQATIAGNTITWSPLTLTGTKMRAFRVQVTLHPPFGAAGPNGFRFQAQVFQDAYGLAAAPYCALPARDVAVAVKYI